MTSSTARQRRQQKTRQAILAAAHQIIVEKGPDELSMRSLAERIDYSPSGLYEYFDSKEQILETVCEEGHGMLAQAMRQVDETLPPDAYLLEIGQVYVDFAAANPALFRLMFSNIPAEPPDPALISNRSSYLVLIEAIQRGIASGVFLQREGFGLHEMAFAAWSMVHGIAMLQMYMKDLLPGFEASKQQALFALGRGLMCP